MKNFLMGLMVAVFVAGSSVAARADEGAFVASKNSDKYHTASCSVVKQIAKENQVTYKTPGEALKAGLKPCQKCNPPASDDYLVGSKNSTVYHVATCNLAKKINPENAVYFADKAAAGKAGYKACQVCLSEKAAK